MFAGLVEDAHATARQTTQGKYIAARSIQWHLSVLCAIFILPILSFVGWLLWHYTGAERHRIEQQRIETLQKVAGAVERDLAVLKATAELAASAPLLVSGEPRSAEDALRELARALDMNIALRTTSGQPLITTEDTRDQKPMS